MAVTHSFVKLFLLTLLYGCCLGFLDDSIKLTYNLVLSLEPKQVSRAHSENVKLRCESGKKQNIDIEKFSMIRILKQDPADSTGTTWLTIVQKNNIVAAGAVLEYVWPVATSATFGVYHCDVIGFTADASIVTGNTPNIEIKMSGVTANDLLDVLVRSKTQLQKDVSNNTAELGDLWEKFEALKEQERNRSDLITRRLAASENAMETVMHRLLYPQIPWPSGKYALLQPDTGCPLDMRFYGGHTGFFTIHAESTSSTSKTEAKPGNHLAKPVVTTSGNDVLVHLKFCTASVASSGIPWPQGEYCVHSFDGTCPTGLSLGTIKIYTEITNNKNEVGGNHPSSSPATIQFCCMTTGAYSTPVVLPTEKPFYLYRYKSPCQVVTGMNVRLDFFEVAVEESNSYNAASGEVPYTIFNSQSRKFELCYYTKK